MDPFFRMDHLPQYGSPSPDLLPGYGASFPPVGPLPQYGPPSAKRAPFPGYGPPLSPNYGPLPLAMNLLPSMVTFPSMGLFPRYVMDLLSQYGLPSPTMDISPLVTFPQLGPFFSSYGPPFPPPMDPLSPLWIIPQYGAPSIQDNFPRYGPLRSYGAPFPNLDYLPPLGYLPPIWTSFPSYGPFPQAMDHLPPLWITSPVPPPLWITFSVLGLLSPVGITFPRYGPPSQLGYLPARTSFQSRTPFQ
ncbi:extensin-like [Penaeus monodon]|uniref:extensin-like n=1 Tax=Penaeus monodon TaxID=6687 RepID=UPI0018A7043D|nr:extensin-like [Penaeus monodon]